MSLPRLLAAALALSAATGAQAATGSGTISFEFTSFSGAYGLTDPAMLGDPSQWLRLGSVNGAIPTYNGVTVPYPHFPGYVTTGGTAPLSGQSVSMIYTNTDAPPGGWIASVITFTPESGFTNVSTGQAFKLGTLSFTNGQWVGGAPTPAQNFPVNLGFRLATSSSTPEFNQVVNDALVVVTNETAGDCTSPADHKDNADFIYLAGAPQLGSMRVFDQLCKPATETNSGTIDVWARFGSLEYADLRNPGGSAFFEPSVDIGPIDPIPEPSAWAVMILGFGLAGSALRFRRLAAA